MFRLKSPVPEDRLLFSNRDLLQLMLPLIAEQFLVIFVGLVDTAMVSYLSEAAVSGVSLVDMVNQLIIQVLLALATGGAVISAQYIGHKEAHKSCEAANQLYLLVLLIGLGLMVFFMAARRPFLRLFFGSIDADVMAEAMTYLFISAMSYPFLALYNAGTAIFRSMKKTYITLLMSLLMNAVNIVCNTIFIFGMNMGVAGAALGSLAGRAAAAVTVSILLMNPKHQVHLVKPVRPLLDRKMAGRILYIAVPNGTENGMFQLGKILVLSIIATFGTTQIAANAVANSISGVAVIPGLAIGTALITVVGQCVGARDYPQAEYFIKKMVGIAGVVMFVWNGLLLLARPLLLMLFSLSDETRQLAYTLLWFQCGFGMFLWVPAFVLPNGLRAANDVRFTMVVGVFSMWMFRVGFSLVLGRWLGWGAVGVWSAMVLDWIFRLSFFIWRFRSGKWKRVQLI